jgi:hypothetical protein
MSSSPAFNNGKGYILRNRRRLKDSSSIMPIIKTIFDILCSENILAKDIWKFYSSKLALPVILPIDDYNYNINRVDLVD